MTTSVASRLYLAAAAAWLAGCSGSSGPAAADKDKSTVRGKLLDKGKPLSIDQSKLIPKGATGLPPGTSNNLLQVVFIPAGGTEQLPAKTDPQAGTFEVAVKPGRYKIAITASAGMGPGMPDYFGGKFTPDKTAIVRDVKGGEEIEIDVSKPQG